MLTITDLTASYGEKIVLDNINLHLGKNETIAIIGESGAGKTTLALAIAGLSKANIRGEITYRGKNLNLLPEDEFRSLRWNEIALVPQNVGDSLNPVHRVIAQVAEPMLAHGLKNKKEALTEAKRLLDFAGLDAGTSTAYPHELSGGQKQRVLVAMSLSNNPSLIILDEPTSSLDPISKAEITKLLVQTLKSRAGIVITHDISLAAKLAQNIAVMYAGRILEFGPTRQVLANPMHPYTRGLLRSYPNMTTTKDLQGIKGRYSPSDSGCAFCERCTQKIDICSQKRPQLETSSNGRLVACHRGGIIPFLKVNNLNKSYGKKIAAKNISFTIYEGETLSLVGESGSGKTTVAHCITGLIKPDCGDIYLEQQKVTKYDNAFYSTVQLIFQNPMEALSHRLTILEAVREPLDIQGRGSIEQRNKIAIKALTDTELPSTPDFYNKYPHHLSGGEAQRVSIARALVVNPSLLIADEPTSALDASVQAKILKLLMRLQEERGLSILFITHDIALARKISDHIAVMQSGCIVEYGPASRVITSPTHPYTQKLMHSAPSLLENY